MKFTLSSAMSPVDELTELAKTAEEYGYHAIAMPDSLFYSETVSADYPYTPDGSRMWNADTPWVDPLVGAAAMATATSTLRFYTSVLKLGSRNPVLLARQIGSVAALSGNRFGLGVGVGWAPEEFRFCGTEYAGRGPRTTEAIEVLKLILGGGMVSHQGKYFEFDKLQMSPAPSEPVPIYVGGHSEPALRRAAKHGDGWASAMMTLADLEKTINRLAELRREYGRQDTPFEIQGVCVDRFGVDGYRAQQDIGVTDAIVVPWMFYGTGFDGGLTAKKDGIKRFADEVISQVRS